MSTHGSDKPTGWRESRHLNRFDLKHPATLGPVLPDRSRLEAGDRSRPTFNCEPRSFQDLAKTYRGLVGLLPSPPRAPTGRGACAVFVGSMLLYWTMILALTSFDEEFYLFLSQGRWSKAFGVGRQVSNRLGRSISGDRYSKACVFFALLNVVAVVARAAGFPVSTLSPEQQNDDDDEQFYHPPAVASEELEEVDRPDAEPAADSFCACLVDEAGLKEAYRDLYGADASAGSSKLLVQPSNGGSTFRCPHCDKCFRVKLGEPLNSIKTCRRRRRLSKGSSRRTRAKDEAKGRKSTSPSTCSRKSTKSAVLSLSSLACKFVRRKKGNERPPSQRKFPLETTAAV